MMHACGLHACSLVATLREQVAAIVDVFTMSCRALGRGVEHRLLSRLAYSAGALAAPDGAARGSEAGSQSIDVRRDGSASMMMLIRCKRAPKQRNQVCPCRGRRLPMHSASGS